jgi:hypothetical protein
MDTKRKAAHDKSVIRPWYRELEQLIDQYNCGPHDLLNFDEMGARVACPAGMAVYIPVQYKNVRNIV